MSLKKAPNLLTEEELLSVLERAPKTQESTQQDNPEVLEYKNDIIPFLSVYNLQPGDFKVSVRLLYAIYRTWSENPVNTRAFSVNIGKFLPKSRVYKANRYDQSFYRVNQNALKLANDAYNSIKSSRDQRKSPKWKAHFDNFLKKFSIAAGTYWIEVEILYYLYDKWCYSIKRKNQIGEKHFLRFCELYFEKKKSTEGGITWFGVNESIMNAYESGQIERLRDVCEKKRKEAKKNKKKSKKIS